MRLFARSPRSCMTSTSRIGSSIDRKWKASGLSLPASAWRLAMMRSGSRAPPRYLMVFTSTSRRSERDGMNEMTRDNALVGEPRAAASAPHGITFGEALRVWVRVAALSFGGPAGQIAVMHRIIVDERKWVGESRFLHALSYCMLLPGPEAHQLAIYIGWLMHRWPGAIMAGGRFVLPD